MSCQYLQGLGQLSLFKHSTLIINYQGLMSRYPEFLRYVILFPTSKSNQNYINNSQSVNQPSKKHISYLGNPADVLHELQCCKQVSFTLHITVGV